jgi:hypothetical protein
VEEFNEKRIQNLPIILTERAYLPSKEVTNPKRLKSCSSVRVRAQNLMGEAATEEADQTALIVEAIFFEAPTSFH